MNETRDLSPLARSADRSVSLPVFGSSQSHLPFSGPASFPAFRGSSPAAYAKGAEVQHPEATRSESMGISMTGQRSEITIRTRDGDVVKIRLMEKTQEAWHRTEKTMPVDTQDVEGSVSESATKHDSHLIQQLASRLGQDAVSDTHVVRESGERSFHEHSVRVTTEEGSRSVQSRVLSLETSRFEFEVEGDLNREELEAIGALVEDVDSLAEDFFGGNMQGAIEKGLQMGYDRDVLAGYALELKNTEVRVVADRYQSFSPDSKRLPGGFERALKQYVERFQSMMERAETWLESDSLKTLLDTVSSAREREGKDGSGFRGFHQRILGSYPRA